MKKILRKMMIAAMLCCCAFLLISCSGGIKGSEAKAYINEFFAAVSDEDYSKAENLLHPDRTADLETFFLNIEEEKGIDFQKGIVIEKYTGFESSFYHSEVAGSRYQLTMKTTVGDASVRFTVEIVKNEAGYGIYNLEINT